MGKNFYIQANGIPPRRWMGYIELVKGNYGIHIAKVSAGWKPLFQEYPFIHSVEELRKEYLDTGCTLYDEYGQVYSWDDFISILDGFQLNGSSWVENDAGCYKRDEDGYEFSRVLFE